jgi:hypothetical protein
MDGELLWHAAAAHPRDAVDDDRVGSPRARDHRHGHDDCSLASRAQHRVPGCGHAAAGFFGASVRLRAGLWLVRRPARTRSRVGRCRVSADTISQRDRDRRQQRRRTRGPRGSVRLHHLLGPVLPGPALVRSSRLLLQLLAAVSPWPATADISAAGEAANCATGAAGTSGERASAAGTTKAPKWWSAAGRRRIGAAARGRQASARQRTASAEHEAGAESVSAAR